MEEIRRSPVDMLVNPFSLRVLYSPGSCLGFLPLTALYKHVVYGCLWYLDFSMRGAKGMNHKFPTNMALKKVYPHG